MPEAPKDRSPGWKRDPEDVSKIRYWNGEDWAPSTPVTSVSPVQKVKDSDVTQTVEPNPLALGLSFIGAALVGLGLFLPRLESRTSSAIVENSLIRSDQGIILAVLALGVAFATFRFSQGEGRRFSVLILGLVISIAALVLGTGSSLELESLSGSSANQVVEKALPGLGIYTVGVGGALIMVAGFMLAGFPVEGVHLRPMRKTTKCPSCAETILVEAKVCKHCGRDVVKESGIP